MTHKEIAMTCLIAGHSIEVYLAACLTIDSPEAPWELRMTKDEYLSLLEEFMEAIEDQ